MAISVVTGASEEQLKNIKEFGINLGLAFQIVDDILDVTGEVDKMGKKVGSDKDNNKVTYPSLCGVEESRIRAKSFIDRAKDALSPFGENNKILLELADFVLKRSN